MTADCVQFGIVVIGVLACALVVGCRPSSIKRPTGGRRQWRHSRLDCTVWMHIEPIRRPATPRYLRRRIA